MKKMVVLWMLCVLPLFAEKDNIWRMFELDQKAILITSNCQMWELNYLTQNVQSWGEWFSRTPAPQVDSRYHVKDRSWKGDPSLLIQETNWSSTPEAQVYRQDQTSLSRCTHTIENLVTQEVAYARKIDQREFLALCQDLRASYMNASSYDERLRLAKNMQKLNNFMFEIYLASIQDVKNNNIVYHWDLSKYNFMPRIEPKHQQFIQKSSILDIQAQYYSSMR